MISIPFLTQGQLELLRLAKQNSVEGIELSYELPFIQDKEPPIDHPAFIQRLIDTHLIQVKMKGTFLRASKYQQESWARFCEGIDHPTQEDWELWRKGYMTQSKDAISSFMLPGKKFDEFSRVWVCEINIQAIQPSNL